MPLGQKPHTIATHYQRTPRLRRLPAVRVGARRHTYHPRALLQRVERLAREEHRAAVRAHVVVERANALAGGQRVAQGEDGLGRARAVFGGGKRRVDVRGEVGVGNV